jgi:hypothetical protein
VPLGRLVLGAAAELGLSGWLGGLRIAPETEALPDQGRPTKPPQTGTLRGKFVRPFRFWYCTTEAGGAGLRRVKWL